MMRRATTGFCFSMSAVLLWAPAVKSQTAAGLETSEASTGTPPQSGASSERRSDEVRAQTLFDEGRALVAHGNYEQACSKFESSLALTSGVGTVFNLADCYEHTRRTASAAQLYRRVARLARANGQEQRARVAEQRAEALESRLSKLLIRLADPYTEISVRRNGTPLKDELGHAVAVDPGLYQVTASAPGRRTWSSKVEVPDGAVIVSVEVPALDELPSAVAPASPAGATPPPASEHQADAPDEQPHPAANAASSAEQRSLGSPGLRRAALVVGGLGIGAVVTGAVFLAQYKSSDSDARSICPANYGCSSDELEQHATMVDDSKRSRRLAYIGFGIGGVALAGAAALFVSSQPRTERSLEPSVALGPDGSFGAALHGKF